MSRSRLDYLMIAFANAALPIFVVLRARSGDLATANALLIGTLSAILVNGALLAGIGIRKKRAGQRISRTTLLFVLVMGIASIGSVELVARFLLDPDDVVKLAYSNKPLARIYPEPKRLVVELMRHRQQSSDEYQRVAARARPLSPSVYSSESFANTDVMRTTISSLQAAAAVDFGYAARRSRQIADFRREMERIDPHSMYLQAWSETEASDESLARIEKDWLTSTVKLYEYAISKVGETKLVNGKLLFRSDAERLEFARLIEESRSLNTRLQTVSKNMKEAQARARADLALDK